MSLQFYFGASGAGKSKKLHDDIIEESIKHPERNYLLIVPDQFTMQTQMDLVVEHPQHAIMNIDVLSFGRLTHRVIEEVGGADLPILDDTGEKSGAAQGGWKGAGETHGTGKPSEQDRLYS